MNENQSASLSYQKKSTISSYQALVEEFSGQGDFLTQDDMANWLSCYDRDSQSFIRGSPTLVFRPSSCSVIPSFVEKCGQARYPLTARSGGTGLTGGSVAPQDGIVLLVGHLRKILDYQAEKGLVVAEPGVTPNQLNRLCRQDGWHFPLEMATNGVAGLGGCLSCQSTGYHQTRPSILQHFQSVQLADGQGRLIEAPASFVCGAEGMFGIILSLTIQLTRFPHKRLVLEFDASVEELISRSSAFLAHSTLKSLLWRQDKPCVALMEGETWRVEGAFQHLKANAGFSFHVKQDWRFVFPSPPAGCSFLTLSHSAPSSSLLRLQSSLHALSKEMELGFNEWINLLEGSLHIVLYAPPSLFSKNIQRFLIAWVDRLQDCQGFIVSRHGVGAWLAPYLPPFINEDNLALLKQLRSSFDPFCLFSRGSFFPEKGKRLERTGFA